MKVVNAAQRFLAIHCGEHVKGLIKTGTDSHTIHVHIHGKGPVA